MNRKLNKVELKIFGAGGRYICIDALDKDSIIEIYDNLDKGEVVKELARLSWDYAGSIKGIAVCRINLKDGSVFYDIIKRGSSDMYPDIYPAIASVPVDFNIIDNDSDAYLEEYREEINKRVIEICKDCEIEIDYPEQYKGYYTIAEDVINEHGTTGYDLRYKAYEDSLFTDYVFNDNFSDIIDEIYEKGMQL